MKIYSSGEIEQILREHARRQPRSYQIEGVRRIVNQNYLLLGDEMRLGKSKQTIDAAYVLHRDNFIDRVIVICPASVKSVWFERTTCQISQHLWNGVKTKVTEFHSNYKQWTREGEGRWLYWIVTNYEFIRDLGRVQQILKSIEKQRVMLILDESSFIKNHRSQQTQASLAIRLRCQRVYLLNGTPVSHSPGDMFAQAEMMSSSILKVSRPRRDGSVRPMSGYFQFRGRYAKMGGWKRKQIIGWQNLEDLQERLKSFVLVRRTEDQFDLPKREYESFTVRLTDKTWKIYKSMRDDLISWLDDNALATAMAAGTKVMRLSQITSGFIGGVECALCLGEGCDECARLEYFKQIGTEKLDFFTEWLNARLDEDRDFKLVVWCRFRAQLERIHLEISRIGQYRNFPVAQIHGGQKASLRAEAERLLHPLTSPKGQVIVSGTPSTGGMGLNFAGAAHEIYLSNDRKLITRQQSEARIAGPEQLKPVWVGDVFAVGPNGQRTIDHVVVEALKAREDLATWTRSEWVHALKETLKEE